MKGTKTKLLIVVRGMLAAILALGIVVALPANDARADQAAVRDTASGVMKFNWFVPDMSGSLPDELITLLNFNPDMTYSRGSCFLINEDTVVTAYHCTFFSENELNNLDTIVSAFNKERNTDYKLDRRWLKEHMTYTVNVNRDMQIGATLINRSEESDFAIFKLDQSIAGYTPLTFRDSSTVEAAESIYSVGFPANSDLTAVKMYNPKDATIKGGTVSKPEALYQGYAGGPTGLGFFAVNGYFVQSDCVLSGGDSGGPMVDADGNVVGISVIGIAGINDESDIDKITDIQNFIENNSYYLAVASDKLMEALDTLKISYASTDKAPEPSPEGSVDSSETNELSFAQLNSTISEAEGKAKADYTAESYAALEDALEEAEDVLNNTSLSDPTDKDEYKEKQAAIDEANSALKKAIRVLEPASSGSATATDAGQNNMLPILIGAVAAAIIGIIVAIVIMNRGKKKAESAPQPAPQPAPKSAPQPQKPQTTSQRDPGTTVLSEGAEGTTVLDDGSGDTTILGEQINGGTLTRMSNNEQIIISRSDMTLGRERKSVDYCLEGNGNIGRVHARIVVRDNKVFIVDNNSTNGTYVNNTKLRSGQEQQLNNGDIVKLADERFRYSL